MFGKLAVNFFGNNVIVALFCADSDTDAAKRTLLNNSLFLIMVISYMMFVMLLFE